MLTWKLPRYLRHGLAMSAIVIISGIWYLLDAQLDARAPYFPFLLVIVAVVFWCGRAPAILGAFLSLGISLLFAAANGLFAADIVEDAAFIFNAGGVFVIADAATRCRKKLIESEQRAEDRSAEATRIAEELNLQIERAKV